MKKDKTRRKISKFKIYLSFVSMLLAWVSIFLVLILKKYDILPLKYFLVVSCGLGLFSLVLIILMMKKKMKRIIKVIASIFALLVIGAVSLGLVYIHKTFKFLNNLVDDGYTIRNYSIIVLKDNNYTSIEDLEGKNVSYYISNKEDEADVLGKLDSLVNVTKNESDEYGTLVRGLYSKKIDAIMMEESYFGILEETYSDFKEKAEVLYTIEIKTKTETIVKEVNVNKETFNVYITGIDTYGKISSVSRSDVNIVVTVNPATKQVLLTSIPRDYYVQLDGTEGGLKDKLTHAGIYGVEKSIKTIENLLDIDINYYFKVNFTSLEKIVDALGGVDVYSMYTFDSGDGTIFHTGYNRVNGPQALMFARTRYTVQGGDRTRGKNQQALIQAILKKACSKEIITKYSSLLNSLEGSFQTNMSTDKMTDIIKKQINDMTPWTVTSVSLDGTNGNEYTYSYAGQKLYVMIPNEETVETAKDMIQRVTAGEIFDSSYTEDDSNVRTPSKVTRTYTPVVQPKPQEQPVPTPEPEPAEEPATEPAEPTTDPTTEPTDPPTEPTEPTDPPTDPNGNSGGGQTGNTGGNSGGNTGGNTGGNSGGNSGGNTGGNSGGNSGGSTGGNTGGSNTSSGN